MSWLGSLISGLFGIGQQAWSNAYNSSEAQKDRDFQSEEAELNRIFQSDEASANRDFQSDEADLNRIFQSEEAALQRDWSAAEAEQARDWQEEMYAKYNSLSGKITQAEQAGVNPMFAITGNAVTPMSASSSMPSGSSAGSVGTPSGSSASGSGVSGSRATSSLVNILGAILDGAKLKSEIALNESMANKNNAEAEGQKITNEQLHDMNAAEIMSKLSHVELNDANIELIASKVLNTEADTAVKGAQLGQIAAEIANTEADTNVKVQQIGLMFSEMMKNQKSLDVMDAQIIEMGSVAGVNRAHASVLAQEFRNLVQEHSHQEVMNAFSEITASRDSGEENGYYRTLSEVKRFINSFLGWWSGTTSVELPHKKPARIGFK